MRKRERLESRKEQRKKWVNLREGLRFILFTIYIDYFIFPRTYKIQEKKGEGGIRG